MSWVREGVENVGGILMDKDTSRRVVLCRKCLYEHNMLSCFVMLDTANWVMSYKLDDPHSIAGCNGGARK